MLKVLFKVRLKVKLKVKGQGKRLKEKVKGTGTGEGTGTGKILCKKVKKLNEQQVVKINGWGRLRS